jgi:hypothetical protein
MFHNFTHKTLQGGTPIKAQSGWWMTDLALAQKKSCVLNIGGQ